ncbi:hypothetical protein KFK09_020702 [Dendrobium nobile]|uniref:RING-type domain-containing protein n=1 Tax=Dendrobium nobile TaxID=94219 RepID=A0A8T3AN73_DENNO|nr:hypothetical protein KFK09_020702 [Dendrobium nobile]
MEAKPESDLVAVHEKQDANDSIADEWAVSEGLIDGYGACAICLEKIKIQEAAIVKGCEHAYCTICILRWATYKEENPSCPQCKNPFEFLNVHRSLDGCIHECMFEESVWLLLRAAWFVPLIVEPLDDSHEEEELFQYYYDDDDDNGDDDEYDAELNESYITRASSSIRIGNRRWGDNGYVRAGRKEARPLSQRPSKDNNEAGSSRQPKNKEVLSNTPPTGRRAKRALKREAANKAAASTADKAAAAKHQQHLQRLGRK